MTRDAIREAVITALTGVAPEIDPSAIGPDDAFRQAFDLDSMDMLNFVIALHAAVGVDVAETDYGKLATLNATVDYLARRLERGGTPEPVPRSSAGSHVT